ncbi:unnamed protein product [Ilex paraguariensis]|uniref:Uncharacterized protein n=1 Tax=Ilex paraguariensis TaxID=185542 RepID=A0ABC8SDG3_9AQUA
MAKAICVLATEKLADDYMSHITNLQSKGSSLEERSSSLSKTLDSARQDSMEWKRKYEQISSKQKIEEDQVIKPGCRVKDKELRSGDINLKA